MTPYRELKPYKKYTFTSGVDTYGQKRQLGSTYTNIQACIKPYTHSQQDSPLFTDVQLIGLTNDAISTENQVEVDNRKYNVIYVQANPRFTEFFLRLSK